MHDGTTEDHGVTVTVDVLVNDGERNDVALILTAGTDPERLTAEQAREVARRLTLAAGIAERLEVE